MNGLEALGISYWLQMGNRLEADLIYREGASKGLQCYVSCEQYAPIARVHAFWHRI